MTGPSRPTTDIGGVDPAANVALDDLEACMLEQALVQPGERRVLVPDVRLELAASPALGRSRRSTGEPLLDLAVGVGGLEVVDEITEDEDAAVREQCVDAGESDALPEVGQ